MASTLDTGSASDREIVATAKELLSGPGGHTEVVTRIPNPETFDARLRELVANEALWEKSRVRKKLFLLLEPAGEMRQRFDPEYLTETWPDDYPRTGDCIFYDYDACQIEVDKSFKFPKTVEKFGNPVMTCNLHLQVGWQNVGNQWRRVVGVWEVEPNTTRTPPYEEAFQEFPEARRSLRNFFNASERKGTRKDGSFDRKIPFRGIPYVVEPQQPPPFTAS